MTDPTLPDSPEERAALLRSLKEEIIAVVERREAMKEQMASWYADGRGARYPFAAQLETLDIELSRLDTQYKALWDRAQGKA